jgi:hypothetical protein
MNINDPKDNWENLPDREERLGFDMDSGGVTFESDNEEFEDFEELPVFQKIKRKNKIK